MSNWDSNERRRQEERDWERRRDEQEAREQRRRFEMELASSVTDNAEALQVLSGLADERLSKQIMGLLPALRVPVDELGLPDARAAAGGWDRAGAARGSVMCGHWAVSITS